MISSWHAASLALQPQQTLVVTGFDQLVDEGGGRGELTAQDPRPVRCDSAGAGIAEGDHVLAARRYRIGLSVDSTRCLC